jgi:hypothetical protein
MRTFVNRNIDISALELDDLLGSPVQGLGCTLFLDQVELGVMHKHLLIEHAGMANNGHMLREANVIAVQLRRRR